MAEPNPLARSSGRTRFYTGRTSRAVLVRIVEPMPPLQAPAARRLPPNSELVRQPVQMNALVATQIRHMRAKGSAGMRRMASVAKAATAALAEIAAG